MKEIRKEKVGGTGKGRSESSRGLGRSTLVARVAGLARLVRPLVDTVVVTAAVLAPRAIGRAAERLAVLRTVLHRVRPLRLNIRASGTPRAHAHACLPPTTR